MLTRTESGSSAMARRNVVKADSRRPMATRKERVVVMGQRKTGISGDGRLKLALGRCPIPIVPEERVGQRVVRLGVGWVRAEPRWPPISVRSNAVGGCSPDCGIGNDLRKTQVA